jgi:hypothetical protein
VVPEVRASFTLVVAIAIYISIAAAVSDQNKATPSPLVVAAGVVAVVLV